MTAEQKEIFKCLDLSETDIENYVRTLEWGKVPDVIYNKAEKKKAEKAKRVAEAKEAKEKEHQSKTAGKRHPQMSGKK